MNELFRRLKLKPALSIEIGIASLFANILALATPLFVIQVLNRYISQGVDATLLTLTTGALLAVILEFLFRQIRVKLSRCVSEQANADISLAGYAVLLKAKAGALERVPVGHRSQIMNAAQKVENAYGANNISAIFDVPFSLLFIGVLYLLSPVLAGIVGVFLAFVYITGRIGSHHCQKITRQLMQESTATNMLVHTASDHIDTVRAFNASGFLYRSWIKLLNKSIVLRRSSEVSQSFNSTLSQSVSALMSIVIIAIGATLVVGGSLDVGTMIGANILAARALMPIIRFSQLGVVFASASESLQLLKEFSSIPQETSAGSTKPEYKGNIELRGVSFTYPGSSSPLFEALSLTMAPNTILAICGSNGTGKSTLARLFAGVLEPVRGQILVDGLDLQQASISWWRSQIAYLPQEPTLLNATIRENLLVVNPQADEEKISRAIRMAGLSKYLDESPDGLEAYVSNNGANISLGIRRRIALARALLSACKVAIFDEPTEGLDRDGVACVYAAITELATNGCTIIVISHDSKIVKGAHLVIDLNVKPVPRVSERPHFIETPSNEEKEVS